MFLCPGHPFPGPVLTPSLLRPSIAYCRVGARRMPLPPCHPGPVTRQPAPCPPPFPTGVSARHQERAGHATRIPPLFFRGCDFGIWGLKKISRPGVTGSILPGRMFSKSRSPTSGKGCRSCIHSPTPGSSLIRFRPSQIDGSVLMDHFGVDTLLRRCHHPRSEAHRHPSMNRPTWYVQTVRLILMPHWDQSRRSDHLRTPGSTPKVESQECLFWL